MKTINCFDKKIKDAYFDFEKTLKIKLEENKSEIKRLIEDERLKVKEIITSELDKRTEISPKKTGWNQKRGVNIRDNNTFDFYCQCCCSVYKIKRIRF